MNAWIVFLQCIACGVISGVPYSVLYGVGTLLHNQAARIITDTLYFVALTAFAVGVATVQGFPAFRFYMYFGIVSGWILYCKSVHRILAFLGKTCYNKIGKYFEKKKAQRECRKDGKKNSEKRKNAAFQRRERKGKTGKV